MLTFWLGLGFSSILFHLGFFCIAFLRDFPMCTESSLSHPLCFAHRINVQQTVHIMDFFVTQIHALSLALSSPHVCNMLEPCRLFYAILQALTASCTLK